jgi:hypothetical protein
MERTRQLQNTVFSWWRKKKIDLVTRFFPRSWSTIDSGDGAPYSMAKIEPPMLPDLEFFSGQGRIESKRDVRPLGRGIKRVVGRPLSFEDRFGPAKRGCTGHCRALCLGSSIRSCVILLTTALLVFDVAACSRRQTSAPRKATAVHDEGPASGTLATPSPVQTEFRNVDFHVGSGVVLHIRRLRGELARTREDEPPTFDDPTSFMFKMRSGHVALTPEDLAALMNHSVFNYPEAPLHDIKISISGDRLKQQGTLRKGVGIPFELEGTVSATPDGLVRLHSTHIKSAHLPVKGLMDLFGVKLAGMVNLHESQGMRIEGDDILLNPNYMMPPPRIEGKVSAAGIEDGQLVLRFGIETGEESRDREALPLPYPAARNYMYFRGGTLRFGKLTMIDSDLEIVDMEPGDPFDFDLAQYNRQLVGGYSRSTAAGSLITFMPDLHQLGRTSSSSTPADRRPPQ